MNTKTRYTVHFHGGSTDRTVRVLLPSLNDYDEPITERDVIEAAVRKAFGRNCGWQPDRGIEWAHFGQVYEPVPRRLGHGNSTITGCVRAYVTRGY